MSYSFGVDTTSTSKVFISRRYQKPSLTKSMLLSKLPRSPSNSNTHGSSIQHLQRVTEGGLPVHDPAKNHNFEQVPEENPFENLFFQLTPSRKITDTQLYQEFKRDYMMQRVNLVLQKRRRFQVHLKRMGEVDNGMRLKKFPKKIGCRFEALRK